MNILVAVAHTASGVAGCGANKLVNESNVSREVCPIIVSNLKQLGHNADLIRVDEANNYNFEDCYKRANIANSDKYKHYDLYVEIHLNDSSKEESNGTEVFVFPGHQASINYAKNINKAICDALGTFDRTYGKGYKEDAFIVLKETLMPAVLVESFFCNNQGDVSKFTSKKLADAITKGIDSRFNIQQLDTGLKFALDEPASTKIKESDSLKVRGWSLNHKKLEILIDGINYGTIETGKQREDVYKAYPEYNNHYSGYEKVINFKGITNGGHKCTIKATDSNNKVHEVTKWFYIDKPLKIALDTPNGQTLTKGNVNVTGWALTGLHTGIGSVEVLLNNESYGFAKMGSTRTDVAKVFPYYPNNEKCGYYLDIPLDKLENGDYIVKVIVKADNEILESTRNFKINKPTECKCELLEKENNDLKDKIEKVKEAVK